MLDVFTYPDIAFPKGFLWGASTAGQQIEGNNCSFFDDPETAPSHIWNGGQYIPAGKACNSYELYKEDIAILRELNLGLYRFSVEWCRLEPEKAVYDTDALNHYLQMMSELKDAGIKVCLTLHHMSHPVWFHKKGHFNTLDNLKDWEDYLEYAVPKFAPYVDYWIIINELNLPFEYTLDQRLNMVRYHALGYHIVKKYSDKPASSAHSYSPKCPLRGKHDKLDSLVSEYEDFATNEFFFHAIRTGEIIAPFKEGSYDPTVKGTCDYWALNTYVRHMIDGRKKEPLTGHYTASSFKPLSEPIHMDEIFPEIMIDMLMRMNDKPCLITENGLCANDDRFRIVWIASMLQAVHQAMTLGANVLGYSYWSLLDNWEWGSFTPTFGLVSVHPETFARTIKPSGYYLKDIACNNGLYQADLRRYLDRLPSRTDLSF